MAVALRRGMNDDKNINQLNSFLRGELSAVETYNQAIDKLRNEDATVTEELRFCRDSHQHRVDELAQEVRRLGGEPSRGSGVWGSFAKLVEGSAKLFGKKAAISALEEGEDHGRNDYERDLNDLSPTCREFLQQKIIPEQMKTHATMSKLEHRV